jgi:hypothetical protein
LTAAQVPHTMRQVCSAPRCLCVRFKDLLHHVRSRTVLSVDSALDLDQHSASCSALVPATRTHGNQLRFFVYLTSQLRGTESNLTVDIISVDQEIPRLLWNPNVPTVFTAGRHRTLSWARWIQFIPSQPTCFFIFISILSTSLRLCLPCCLIRFEPKLCTHFSSALCVLRLPSISHSLIGSP